MAIGGANDMSVHDHVFLEKISLQDYHSKKYIYYAYRGNELTETEYQDYAKTWQNQH